MPSSSSHVEGRHEAACDKVGKGKARTRTRQGQVKGTWVSCKWVGTV